MALPPLLPSSLLLNVSAAMPPLSLPSQPKAQMPPQQFPFAVPSASDWMAARANDPTLRLVDWKRVLDVARLGVFVVPLRADPDERANILLSANAVDGTVVAPGEIFSFNRTVGERTTDRGYRDGLMFSHGQVVRGTGGGICLVATGLYNAALQAGLALIERHPHSGIVGYAPPGCDASVVYGSEDMRFQNTTDAPVIVKATCDTERVVIGLYGQTPPPGRHILVKTTHLAYIHAPVIETPDPALPPGAAPIVVQKPRFGFDVTVERVVTDCSQVVQRETIVSEHRAPRPKIIHVANPASEPYARADEAYVFADPLTFFPEVTIPPEAPAISSAATVPTDDVPPGNASRSGEEGTVGEDDQ
jgi:hypothetical protein